MKLVELTQSTHHAALRFIKPMPKGRLLPVLVPTILRTRARMEHFARVRNRTDETSMARKA